MEFDTYCGLCCKDCEYKEKNHCGGCIATKGKPFFGACEVADCANSRSKRFCGECENFPCDLLKKYSYDKEYGDNGQRIKNCMAIKESLVREGRKGIDPIGYCGHHCDYCFLGKWCGGCRSNYNSCSFATLFKNGICPNVKCAKDKNLDGCFECPELDRCFIGYYGQKNEYVAKATALFINKYGKQCYTQTLKRAIDAGLNYPKSFDETGSSLKALELLEKYKK